MKNKKNISDIYYKNVKKHWKKANSNCFYVYNAVMYDDEIITFKLDIPPKKMDKIFNKKWKGIFHLMREDSGLMFRMDYVKILEYICKEIIKED